MRKSNYWWMVVIALLALVVLTILRVPMYISLIAVVVGFVIFSIVKFNQARK